MSTTETTLAKAPDSKKSLTLREHLEGPAFKEAIAQALPRHLKPDRFIRVAISAMTRVPKLKECTSSSFLGSLLSLSQYGLEPDGRRAHLIPYKNNKLSQAAGKDVYECQLIIDWKGLSELVYRSGVVSALHADVVHRGDIFDYSMGVLTTHVPHFLRTDADKPKDACEIYAAYSTATMKDGTRKTEVMSVAEIDAIRRRSRAGTTGPWVTDWNEMAKKTVFRRLSKWLPLSSEVRDAVEADDDAIDITATPVGAESASSLSAMLEAPSAESAPADDNAPPAMDEQTRLDIEASRAKEASK